MKSSDLRMSVVFGMIVRNSSVNPCLPWSALYALLSTACILIYSLIFMFFSINASCRNLLFSYYCYGPQGVSKLLRIGTIKGIIFTSGPQSNLKKNLR